MDSRNIMRFAEFGGFEGQEFVPICNLPQFEMQKSAEYRSFEKYYHISDKLGGNQPK